MIPRCRMTRPSDGCAKLKEKEGGLNDAGSVGWLRSGETVNFSDPALPSGMTVEKIRAGIAVALNRFAERGMEADVGFIRPDETAGPTVERLLASTAYDCVVIGAGVRLPPRRLKVFEAVVNAVHKAAPGAAIAFNTRPEDSADAAGRWLKDEANLG